MEQKKEWITYVNNEYIPQSEVKLSILDHGILYGDRVFDTCCARNGYIFKLDQHIDFLLDSGTENTNAIIEACQLTLTGLDSVDPEWKEVLHSVIETLK